MGLRAALPQYVQLRRQLTVIKGLFFQHSPLLAQFTHSLNLLMQGPKMYEKGVKNRDFLGCAPRYNHSYMFKVIPMKLLYYQTFFETWRD